MNLPAHLCLLWLCVSWLQHASAEDITKYIADELLLPLPLNKLVVDDEAQKVYVSTVNRVYQLDKNLQIEIEAVTGPYMNSPACFPFLPADECNQPLTMMNNKNKLLVIHKEMNRLIVCGTIYSGICEARKLGEISDLDFDLKNGNLSTSKKDFVVCPQEENCDTVALVAPGPLIGNSVLYVATTKPDDAGITYHTDLTFSTRSLAVDAGKENILFREVLQANKGFNPSDGYRRDFKYSFATEEFIYFVFQSTKSWESEAGLARICVDDPTYTSYMQMKITCSGNEVTAAKFVEDGADIGLTQGGLLLVTFKEGDDSHLCSFTIREINEKFDEAQIACFNSSGMKDGVQISDTMDGEGCKKDLLVGNLTLDTLTIRATTYEKPIFYQGYKKAIGKNRCGASYLPKEITLFIPVTGKILLTKSASTFTTLITSSVNDIHDIFIGTKEGQILQYNIARDVTYKEINLGNEVVGDLVLDSSETSIPHYYVMCKDSAGPRTTANKVLRLRAAVCDQYSTCDECSGTKNPHCGWCVLEGRCINHDDTCTGDSVLSSFDDECISATVARSIERTNNETIEIQINMLPTIPDTDYYECIFDGHISVKVAFGDDLNTLRCLAPSSNLLSPSLPGKDHVEVKLAIRYKQTDIVSTTVEFFECDMHDGSFDFDFPRPCAGCINRRPSRCKWCVEKHKCIVTEKANNECLDNTDFCPRVTSIEPDDQLISVGYSKEIRVYVENMPTDGSSYQCIVELDGTEKKVAAVRDSEDLVTCAANSYSYFSNKETAMASVGVSWRPGAMIDMLPNPDVTFYNCSVGRSDCTLCVTADKKFNCGWCDVLSSCTVQQHCMKDESTNGVWITNSQHCPKPQLKSIQPSSGPIAGGTMFSVYGVNMGTSPSDVESITVAGVPCAMDVSGYEVSRKVVCRTGTMGVHTTGTVKVVVRNITISSADEFTYRNPHLGFPDRSRGPQAGGTKVVIDGNDLDTGSSVQVFIGGNECFVQSSTFDKKITCITSSVSKPIADQAIRAVYDGTYETVSTASFTYTENPKISSFYMLSDTLACFKSGGRNITFNGTLFDSIQNPRLKVIFQSSSRSSTRRRRDVLHAIVDMMMTRNKRAISEEEFVTECTVHNSTTMTCVTPDVSLNDDLSDNARMELHLDNYIIPLNTSITYVENPSNFSLVKSDEFRAKSVLEIQVENLNRDAVTVSEVTVKIKNSSCNVESITEKSILCRLPEEPGKQSQYEVTVKIGNFSEEIGSIKYYEEKTTYITWVIIAVAVGVVFLVVIPTIVCCVKKNKQFNLKKNDFEKAMENMEMEVRADFRKAFAELSIDMTDLTTDVWDSGIPCLSYRVYAMNLFFPSVRYHPCMKEPDPTEKPIQAVEQGFSQFEILLNTPHFLTTFVRTLEEQHLFSNRDKGNVASLITVVLHQKLDYFTEVMKTLIADTVKAGVQKNPKLVLRRTESVAERMLSNWIAICLYPYIRDTAGKSFFLLQKAIKHQVSKGPLDAITGKARYTLSDDRLLKEDVQNEILTLFVSQTNATDDEPVIVKVLTCDSTAQVKEKVMDAMYKKIPLSQRPKAEQLDIEWRHGRGGHLILPEKDFALDNASRWRRLMTIKDYKVPNNATLALVSKQQANFPQESNNFIPPNVKTPMLPEEPNAKTYHLVKYSDDIDAKRESTMPRDRKHVNDLYLLRLINMKGILQNYVDDVFKAILDKSSIPSAVKHFFDFLDDLATKHDIDDPDILHIWKTNSVLGRFWVTILNNPEFVFDIDKPESVESSMSVISQTFIDACSVQEHKPTPYSPINKQLYAKEIPTYKRMVHEYYDEIKGMPAVSDQDMHAHMAEISRSHDLKFDTHVALNELWGFVNKYYEELLEALESDTNITPQVVSRLKQAYTLIDSSINNP